MLHRYAGMSFEDFAGEPIIEDDLIITVRPPKLVAVRESFLADLQVGHLEKRADAFRGDEWVAVFIPKHVDGCTRTWVRDDLRGPYGGSNVAEELIFAVCCRLGVPMVSVKRTARSHRVFRRVFDRIKRTIGEA